MSEMIVIRGVRYRREDAVSLGLANSLKLGPVIEEPIEVPNDTETEAEEAAEEPIEVPNDTEDAENEPDANTSVSQSSGSRRKAPRRIN